MIKKQVSKLFSYGSLTAYTLGKITQFPALLSRTSALSVDDVML